MVVATSSDHDRPDDSRQLDVASGGVGTTFAGVTRVVLVLGYFL